MTSEDKALSMEREIRIRERLKEKKIPSEFSYRRAYELGFEDARSRFEKSPAREDAEEPVLGLGEWRDRRDKS